MLRREAEWLGRSLREIAPAALFPLINLGSSTRQLREVQQPWIHGEIFGPIASSGTIVHVDLKPDDGVDLVGDFNDPDVWSAIMKIQPRSVFCSNVLEHVPDTLRPGFCARMIEMVPTGGYLVVSVPHGFPYHPDPIDTMFRPNVAALIALFPGTKLVRGACVPCGTLLDLVAETNPLHVARRTLEKIFSRRPSHASEKVVPGAPLRDWLVPWAYRQFSSTCVVLQRTGFTP